MYKQNLTKTEAETLLAECEEQAPSEFCPLINATCRADCVCFAEACVEKKIVRDRRSDDSTYSVYSGQCDNAMFTEQKL